MLKCQVIMDAMEKIAPKRLAEEWDNPGLLIGSPAAEIHKVLVCLDVSEGVADRAIREGFDMIIAHHPVIFRAMKNLRTDLPQGRLVARLVRAGIAVFAAHTNLDIAAGGVNDVLAERIGLVEVKAFAPEAKGEEMAIESLGRIGRLPEPVTVDEFAGKVRDNLAAGYVRLVRAGDRLIKKVALCSGAGAEFISKAAFLGADVYVTGDVKYHDAQQAFMQGIHVVDAGHFPTEYPVVPVLAERLKELLAKAKGGVEIDIDKKSHDFFEVISV